MRKLLVTVGIALVGFVAFAATASAATVVVPEDGTLLDLAKPFYEAIMGGQWWLAAMFGLILATTAAKRYLPGKAGLWVNGEYGQPLTVVVLAFGGAAAATLVAMGPGAMLSGALAWSALKIAVAAAGGYTLLKQLVVPLLVKIEPKVPVWLRWIFPMLLWAFSKPPAKATAEAAGNDAVVANPPAGTPTGDVTEV